MSAARRSFTVRERDTDRGSRFWFWDPSHFPGPVTPAAETFDLPAMAAGFAAAAAELRRPLAGQHVRVERGFVYFGVDLPATADELEVRERRYREHVRPLLDAALAQWRDVHGPAAERLNEEMGRLARSTGEDAAFVDLLREACRLRAEQWRMHDTALVPAMAATAHFTAAYADRLGGAVALQAMLQGFANRQTEAAEALDRLAETVRERPSLASRLIAPQARGIGRGAPRADRAWFDEALGDFLRRYGRRAEGWDVGAATWIEDPKPVLALIRERLRRPPTEPGWQRRRAAERRERAVAEADARLTVDERPQFHSLLRAAQAYPIVSEDHNAVIDQGGMAALRDVLLAAGGRLVRAGALKRATDVAWLSRDELQDALRAPRDLAALAAARRGRQRRRARLTPPTTLGGPLPAWAADNPTLADFFGLRAEPSGTHEDLAGVGVSAGVAEGRAFVARHLDDLEELAEGDILVCPTTSPAWTPWLALIAGAVTESGGMLSHTAILAREYGIPCVVNVRDATARISTGARIRIDGASGTVQQLN